MWHSDNRITVITGHYGCGKTNLAANLALAFHKAGKRVALCDLDIVNPYFRSADFSGRFEALGIEMILPPFANSNVDVPTLTARVSAAINDPSIHLILDVGGDDAGAAALGRYSADIKKQGYDLTIMTIFTNEDCYQLKVSTDGYVTGGSTIVATYEIK